MENFGKDLKFIKLDQMEILALKNILTEIKNSINEFNRLEAEQRVSELKSKSIENAPINTHREKD